MHRLLGFLPSSWTQTCCSASGCWLAADATSAMSTGMRCRLRHPSATASKVGVLRSGGKWLRAPFGRLPADRPLSMRPAHGTQSPRTDHPAPHPRPAASGLVVRLVCCAASRPMPAAAGVRRVLLRCGGVAERGARRSSACEAASGLPSSWRTTLSTRRMPHALQSATTPLSARGSTSARTDATCSLELGEP